MSPPAPPLLRTALYPFHLAHGAHMVPFAGWEMPLHYGGIIAEHEAVRSAVGLFDVSHMGVLTVLGAGAGALLARRTTADVPKLVPGQVRYTFLTDLEGRIIDDLLITRIDGGGDATPAYVVVPNAATAARVFDLLRQHRHPDTTIARHNPNVAILAVQGPKAPELLRAVGGWSIEEVPVYHARLPPAPGAAERPDRPGPFDLERELGDRVILSRTGYTGEAGAELFVAADRAPKLAEAILAAGARPVGLGARNTLRLEKGYLLSGQDFHGDRTPLEAAQDRFVDLQHEFVGRPRLVEQAANGVTHRLTGLLADAPDAIPRDGAPVRVGGEVVATVTSGAMSPTMRRGIALAYLPVALGTPGTEVAIELRGRSAPARVVKLPFVAAPRRAG